MEKRHQILIVGGGPVGVALAVELGLRGIDCGLVERRLEPQRIPKGQNLSQRTLEHFYFWGVVDELRAARVMPPGYPIGGVTSYGNLMSDYWWSMPDRAFVSKYYFQINERLPQYETEYVLRTKMATLPSVESVTGWAAVGVEQDDTRVRVTIAEEGGSGRETIEADYVVGCDGANSFVRSQVGIERVGSDFDELMVLAVFRSRELHEGLKRFPERSTYRAMQPDQKGYWQFFGRIDVGEGWFFHAPVPADTTTDNYDFHGLIQQAAGFEFAAEFDHVGFWDLRVSVAENYQVGRVFIAGDAAHSHPPYGGFGLNNGLEDVTNIGWKLAAAVEGWGSEALLESYSQERRPVFEETGEDFIASRIRSDREFLESNSPDRDKTAFEQAFEDWKTRGGFRGLTYEPNYEGSSVVIGPPGGICTAHGEHMTKARPGHHLTPAPLSTGHDVFEELGMGFTLVALDADDAAVDAFADAAKNANMPLKVIRDSFDGGREEYESRLMLIRPDQYVVWAGDDASDAANVVAKVVGRG